MREAPFTKVLHNRVIVWLGAVVVIRTRNAKEIVGASQDRVRRGDNWRAVRGGSEIAIKSVASNDCARSVSSAVVDAAIGMIERRQSDEAVRRGGKGRMTEVRLV